MDIELTNMIAIAENMKKSIDMVLRHMETYEEESTEENEELYFHFALPEAQSNNDDFHEATKRLQKKYDEVNPDPDYDWMLEKTLVSSDIAWFISDLYRDTTFDKYTFAEAEAELGLYKTRLDELIDAIADLE